MMPFRQRIFLSLGLLLIFGGVVMVVCISSPFGSVEVFWLGLFLGLGGVGLVVTGFCVARKNRQEAVPGHFLLHPRTGTRYSPHQALAIQRRLDRVRRQISEESRIPVPEPPMPSTPPPWDMEPPPSYDTVMKNQGHALPAMPSLSGER